jgi:hypothetical protein
MSIADVVNAQPSVSLNYPALVAVVLSALITASLLMISGRFDPTGGPLTISLLIVMAMIGATAYCLIYTIPNDDITPGVVGALSAGFGAVVAYWLGRGKG